MLWNSTSYNPSFIILSLYFSLTQMKFILNLNDLFTFVYYFIVSFPWNLKIHEKGF